MPSKPKPSIIARVSRAVKAFRFPTYGGDGQFDGYGPFGSTWFGSGRPPGAEYDYRAEAGLLWQNSVVYSLLAWQAKQCRQAPFQVQKPGEGGKNVAVENHALTKLLRRPNPYWTWSQLMGATLLSLGCAESGSGYWVKIRSGAGKVVQIWWVPHWMMTPMWDTSGTKYVSAYRYRVDNEETYYKPSDVVHLRNDLINPANQRLSLAPFVVPVREICTENDGAGYEASILRNRGIPGVILSAKEGITEEDFTETQRQKYKSLWRENFSGDNAGGVFVSTLPVDVNIPQFSPDKMSLATTRATATSRICSVFGVDPMVIGLPSDSKTYSNYGEANRAAWDGNVIPTQDSIAEQLDLQLLTEFSLDDSELCAFDRSKVPALQEDQTEKYKRIGDAVGGPWMTPNEGRAEAGLDKIADGDKLHEQRAPMGQNGQNGSGSSSSSGRAYRAELAKRWREESA